MKNILGIDITNDKENTHIDGEIFITRRISPDLLEKLDLIYKNNQNLEKNASLPLWLILVKYISVALALINTCAILQPDVSFKEGYQNAPYIYWLTPIFWIIFVILKVIEKTKQKKVYTSENFGEHLESIQEFEMQSQQQLQIPSDTTEIDMLQFQYENKKGKIKLIDICGCKYYNMSYTLYTNTDTLFITNWSEVMEIPLSSIKSIKIQSKKATFSHWNKDEPINSPKYKPFKIVYNNQFYRSKYYSVLIEDIKGEFELFIPNYDVETFCSLTHTNIE